MPEENLETMPLAELGEQITRRASAADDKILGRIEEQEEVPSLCNDGEESGMEATERPDHRRCLISWAEAAPLEEIEKVWAYVQKLEPTVSGSDAEEVAAPAAA